MLLQISLNTLLVASVGYCMLRLRREDQFAKGRESHRKKLSAFIVSLEKTIRHGLKVSDRIVEDVESRQKNLYMLNQLVKNEKSALMELLEEVKMAGYTSEANKQKFQQPWINDKYEKTLKLSAEGFSPREIADRIKLPLGEIELVLNIRK